MTKALIPTRSSSIQVTALDSDLNIQTNEFSTELLQVDDVASVVQDDYILGLPNFSFLEKDIVDNGMTFPIIVCLNNDGAWGSAITNMIKGAIGEYHSKYKYLCLYGNQRLLIARRNKFTHIGAILVTSPFWAISLHHSLK